MKRNIRLQLAVLLALPLVACAPYAQVAAPDVTVESLDGAGVASRAGQNLADETGQALSAKATSSVVCPPATTIKGVDVSAYQPNTNWTSVHNTGVGFAFIKATEGTGFVNGQFAADWKNTTKNNVLRGAYHFFRPAQDPTAQAQLFIKTVGALGTYDLPAVLDWEVGDGVAAATQIQRALTWMQLVESATGKTPIVYTGPYFWSTLGSPASFARFPLFIANYGVSCPTVPSTWTAWTFWQKGDVPMSGITSKTVDLDAYAGSWNQLLAFAMKRK